MTTRNTRLLTQTAMFAVITLVMGMTIGLIPLGFVNVTIMQIPVIIGTILLGLPSGLLLGACFGFASAMSAFGMSIVPQSALVAPLVSGHPALAIVVCLLPRLLIPVTTHFTYRLCARGKSVAPKALPFAAIAGAVTNTVLYLGLMLLFYNMAGLDASKIQWVLGIIAGVGLIGGTSEAVVSAIITSPVVYAIWKAQHKN